MSKRSVNSGQSPFGSVAYQSNSESRTQPGIFEPCAMRRCISALSLPSFAIARKTVAGVGVVEEVALPGPLVVAAVAEPRAAGAGDLVVRAVGLLDGRDLAPDPDQLADLLVDQDAHVRVRPLLEAGHLGAEDEAADLVAAARDELVLRLRCSSCRGRPRA